MFFVARSAPQPPAATPVLGRAVQTPAREEDIAFMRIALEEAAQGDDPYYFGAVIVREGEELARGRNLWRHEQDPTAHAEMVALRRSLAEHGMERLKGTTLYTRASPARCAWAPQSGAVLFAWYSAPRSTSSPPRWVRS